MEHRAPDFAPGDRRQATELLQVACTEFVTSFVEYLHRMTTASMFRADDDGDEDEDDDDDGGDDGAGGGSRYDDDDGGDADGRSGGDDGIGDSYGRSGPRGASGAGGRGGGRQKVDLRTVLLALEQQHGTKAAFMQAARELAHLPAVD
jgi:hypothetical protein